MIAGLAEKKLLLFFIFIFDINYSFFIIGEVKEMGKNRLLRGVSILLAGFFTIVMVYATFLFPEILHALLPSVITEERIDFSTVTGMPVYIGIVAFFLLVVLVVAGFILEKTRLVSLGSLLLYLPTLSYFAVFMWALFLVLVSWGCCGTLSPPFSPLLVNSSTYRI